MNPLLRLLPLLVVVAVASTVRAQVANEFDFDGTQLPVVTIPPNGSTHTITSPVTYLGQNLALNTSLLVGSGGELVLVRSQLRINGNVTLERGGRITVVDSSLLLGQSFQQQFNFRNQGGLLHTERALFGAAYDTGVLHHTTLFHLRGTWLARDTIVQGLVTIISDGRLGWWGDPALKGGSIFADGLYEGEHCDAIHMSGMGDAVLANGTMNVGLYYDAGSSTQPVTSTIDLESTVPLDVVYGDPAIHDGVTLPVAGAPCRLQLSRHRSSGWQLVAYNVSQNAPLHTITLRNMRDAIVGVRGQGVTGSPVLGGPWSAHYNELPGLPSTGMPGYHAIPPGCSVRLGNVAFQSGPSDWNRIWSWGLYMRGASTDLTISGPSLISEILLENGQMHLSGTRSFDLGLHANVVQLSGNASLTIDNAAIGVFGNHSWAVGLIDARDATSCTITDCRTAPLRLRTTAPSAWITAQNLIGVENVIAESGGGPVQVTQANAGQNWDRQNLSMDAAGAGVPFWAVSSFGTALVQDGAPSAPGNTSRELTAQAANASLRKALLLPPETYVTVIANTKLMQSVSTLPQLRISHGGTTHAVAIGSTIGSWRRAHVPTLTVGGAPGPTIVELVAGSAPATVRIDDVRLLVSSWWEQDNLGNLDFEGGYRFTGQAPGYWPAPDAWASSYVRCEPDASVVRPGAAPGSRSMRMTQLARGSDVFKELSFLRPGDQVNVTGWVRALGQFPGAVAQVVIGDGSTWFAATGNNQIVPHACDGVWRQFNVTYTVPASPSITRIDLGCWDAVGTQCWYDDLTVTVL